MDGAVLYHSALLAMDLAMGMNALQAMAAEVYHADPCDRPSLSSSLARTLLTKSPLHAWHEHPRLNPARKPEERAEFDLGSAAHALLLEGEDRMEVIDADSYRTKDAREQRDAARAAGKHPVLKSRYDDVRRMAEVALTAIEGCPDMAGVKLADGQPELVGIWEEEGAIMRFRPDWLADSRAVMLDYKTTTDATPELFTRQIGRMGYHIQAAFYRRGMMAIEGADIPFVLVAQETEPPYAVSFHGCAPSLLAIAEAEVERAIDTWRECVRRNSWPAYTQRIHWAEAAAWQAAEHEERQIGNAYDVSRLWEKQA